MSAEEDTVFIPCEICGEPVEFNEYTEHTGACNSARFVEFHGVSLSDILNPINASVRSESGGESGSEHDEDQEPELASNLISEDEAEEEFQPNINDNDIIIGLMLQEVRRRRLNFQQDQDAGRNIINQDVNIIPNLNAIGSLEPRSIDGLLTRLQNILSAAFQEQNGLANLEDVVVGLTEEQRTYCFTTKRLVPSDTKSVLGTCNICCDENLEEMTTLICGHEMCAKCADKHFSANVKCPFCNQDLRDMINPVE